MFAIERAPRPVEVMQREVMKIGEKLNNASGIGG